MNAAAQIAREALAHERAGRWSDARRAWAAIPRPAPASAASPRARQVGLAHGQVLSHTRRGQLRATCAYEVVDGVERFTYAGRGYPSASAAARAAAADLGYRCPVSYNGWVFWGVESCRDDRCFRVRPPRRRRRGTT